MPFFAIFQTTRSVNVGTEIISRANCYARFLKRKRAHPPNRLMSKIVFFESAFLRVTPVRPPFRRRRNRQTVLNTGRVRYITAGAVQ